MSVVSKTNPIISKYIPIFSFALSVRSLENNITVFFTIKKEIEGYIAIATKVANMNFFLEMLIPSSRFFRFDACAIIFLVQFTFALSRILRIHMKPSLGKSAVKFVAGMTSLLINSPFSSLSL